MTDPLRLRILEGSALAFEVDLFTPLEAGRQRAGEPDPYLVLPATPASPRRLIFARRHEGNCSRQHLRLEPLPGGAVRVTNDSKIPLPLAGVPTTPLDPGAAVELSPPFSISLPPRTLEVRAADSADEHGVHGLQEQTILPGALAEMSSRLRPPPALGPAQMEELAGWLQITVGVLQSSTGSADFLPRAAEALVQIVGLDSGRVLLLDGDRWDVAAAHPAASADESWRPSRHVLDRVRREKRTFWQPCLAPADGDSPSLKRLQAVVAAPLLGCDGCVLGALYGERGREGPSSAGSGYLEAALVELLAGGVASGLARREQERAAARAEARIEEFFGSDLARQIRQNPGLLDGCAKEVTLLFADVRGFSGFSETLGPAKTVEWIGDVMGELSECVLNHDGVLVDYIGDELIAMWGAPKAQPDQAERAARAALSMRAAVDRLNRRWRETLGAAMGLGVGLNTGTAQVGNTGSKHKFKYGPLGNTVNVASRVQGVTKHLRCPLLATAATRRLLGGDFLARRVCKAQLRNINESVDLYEVDFPDAGGQREAFFRSSEEALDALEVGAFAPAARQAGGLLAFYPGDGPLLLVLSRAATQLMQGGAGFDPVWLPPGK